MASIVGLANATGFSRDAISARVKRFELPRDFDPKAVIQLVPLDQEQKNRISLEEARTELAQADTELKKIQRAKLEGQLADVDEVLSGLNDLLEGIAAIIKTSPLEDERKGDILSSIRDHGKKWGDR